MNDLFPCKTNIQLLAEHEVILVKERDEMLQASKIKYDDVHNFLHQLIIIVIPSSWIQLIAYNGGVYRVGERVYAKKVAAERKIYNQKRKLRKV